MIKMKKYLLPSLFFISTFLFILGCKERGVEDLINLHPDANVGKFYVDNVVNEAVVNPFVNKNVLIEDFTGQKCINCPRAHKKADDYDTANLGKVFIVAYHSFEGSLGSVAEPVNKDSNDFRTAFGTKKGNEFVVAKLPQWAINRNKFKGENNVAIESENSWPNYMGLELAKTTNAEISIVSKTFNAKDSSLDLKFKVHYLSSVPEDHYVSVLFTENKIVSGQEVLTGIIPNYVHEHIFRRNVGEYIGLKLDKPKSAGQTYYITAKSNFSPKWNYDNMNIIIVLANNSQTDKSVIQSFGTSLTK